MVKCRSNYLFGGYGWLRVILHLFSEVGVLDQRSPRCYSAWNPPRAPYWDKGKARARRPSLQEVSLSKQFECFRNMEKMSLGGLARSNKTYQNITFLPRFCHSSQMQVQPYCELYARKFSWAGSHCGPKTLQQKWQLSTVVKWCQMVVYEVGDPKTLKIHQYGHIQRGIQLWKLVKTVCAPWILNSNLSTLKHVQCPVSSRAHIPFESRPNKSQNAAEKPPLNQVYIIVVHKWFIVYRILMPTGSNSFRLQSIRKIVRFAVRYCFPVQELLFVWFFSRLPGEGL